MRALSAAAAVLSGCDASSLDLATIGSPITNGVETTGDPAVVALVRRGTPAAFCTGTVISPRLVLTAAHCIEPGVPGQLQIFVGADLAMPDGRYLDVEHVELAPGFDRMALIHDVALVVLSAPSGVAPVLVSQRPFDPSFDGRGIRIVGFGSRGDGTIDLTRKREGRSTIAAYEAMTFVFHPAPSQTCAGDSGGPAFSTFDGVEYLVGITRSGDPRCVEFARDTRIDPFVAGFVAPFIAATAERAAAPGALCYHEASCATGQCRRAPDDARIRYCTNACARTEDCPSGMTCEAGGDGRYCELATPTPTALGAACTTDGDCRDRACIRATADEPRVCGTTCSGAGDLACRAGTECRPTADLPDRFGCFAPTPADAGGCSAGRGAAPWLVALSALWISWLGRARPARAARRSRPAGSRSWPRGTARRGRPRAAACRRGRRATTG